jgi:hypothetical protein
MVRAPLLEQYDILGRDPAKVRHRALPMPQT